MVFGRPIETVVLSFFPPRAIFIRVAINIFGLGNNVFIEHNLLVNILSFEHVLCYSTFDVYYKNKTASRNFYTVLKHHAKALYKAGITNSIDVEFRDGHLKSVVVQENIDNVLELRKQEPHVRLRHF